MASIAIPIVAAAAVTSLAAVAADRYYSWQWRETGYADAAPSSSSSSHDDIELQNLDPADVPLPPSTPPPAAVVMASPVIQNRPQAAFI